MTSRSALGRSPNILEDVRARAVRHGRNPDDVRFYQGLSPIVGGTEAEAKAKEAEYLETFSSEGSLAHLSGSVGVDLGAIDPDRPLETFDSEAMQGVVKSLIESAPPGTRTFRDLARAQMAGQFLTGAAEQVADVLQDWHEKGIDGFNLVYAVTPGTFVDFAEGVVPELQRRGLVQREYAPGTLREKIFGGARLSERHPAAQYRGAFSAHHASAERG